MNKSQLLMELINPRQADADAPPIFCTPVEEAQAQTLTMNRRVWEDMGRPDTITMTIEPGDRLNLPASHPTLTQEEL